MLTVIYKILGMGLYVWYIGMRWTSLGTDFATISNNTITLKWWQAQINYYTAIFTLFFLTVTIFDFNYSFKYRFFYWIAIALFWRNAWYTVEDIIDYINFPSIKQFIYILLDLAMVIFSRIWIFYFKSMS